jgi:hypothetical protein
MAHMIPMAYWQWQTRRCRERDKDVFFMAEAYDGDPAKLVDGNVLDALLESGFDAVYDGDSYETIKHVVEGRKWANDIDGAANPFSNRFHSVLRYAENHDEVRLASKQHWAGVGMDIGKPVSAILFGLGRGPIMLYNGQETGEQANGSEGFSGDDGRSSIFDYGSLPSLVPWVNDHKYDGDKLTNSQKGLRAYYGNLLKLCAEPAFARGDFYGLNHANKCNEDYGRLDGETISGHWLYSFVRRDSETGQVFLVIANLHPSVDMNDIRIKIPEDVFYWIGGGLECQAELTFTDRLGYGLLLQVSRGGTIRSGLEISHFPAQSAVFLEIK